MISNFNQDDILNQIEIFLRNKNIFVTTSWIENHLDTLKNKDKPEEECLKLVKVANISEFIDTARVKSHCDLASYLDFGSKLKYLTNKTFFSQIIGYSNIAEPSENSDKNSDNLDVLDNFESKFLQGDDQPKKTEKVLLKLEMSDGVNTFFGFEYETVKELNELRSSENRYPKVMIGPNCEIRRGMVYLRNDNVKIL